MAMAEIEQGLAELQRNMAAQRINLDNCAALLTDLKVRVSELQRMNRYFLGGLEQVTDTSFFSVYA